MTEFNITTGEDFALIISALDDNNQPKVLTNFDIVVKIDTSVPGNAITATTEDRPDVIKIIRRDPTTLVINMTHEITRTLSTGDAVISIMTIDKSDGFQTIKSYNIGKVTSSRISHYEYSGNTDPSYKTDSNFQRTDFVLDKAKISAYEVAVEAGFQGTKDDWLRTLSFNYGDITQEQKDELKQPAVEAAAVAEAASRAANTAATAASRAATDANAVIGSATTAVTAATQAATAAQNASVIANQAAEKVNTLIETNNERLASIEQLAMRPYHSTILMRGAIYNVNSDKYNMPNSGKTNLTYDQVVAVHVLGGTLLDENNWDKLFSRTKLTDRPFVTLFPRLRLNTVDTPISAFRAFYNSSIEDLDVRSHTSYITEYTIYLSRATSMFQGCANFVNLKGILDVSLCPDYTNMFKGNTSLYMIRLMKVCHDLSFADSPSLALDTTLWAINDSINTEPITITLHATTWSKHSVNTSVIEALKGKQITLVKAP